MPTVKCINLKLPEETHKKLKSRAALAGKTLLDYIIGLIKNDENLFSYQDLNDMPITEEEISEETMLSINRGIADVKAGKLEEWKPGHK